MSFPFQVDRKITYAAVSFAQWTGRLTISSPPRWHTCRDDIIVRYNLVERLRPIFLHPGSSARLSVGFTKVSYPLVLQCPKPCPCLYSWLARHPRHRPSSSRRPTSFRSSPSTCWLIDQRTRRNQFGVNFQSRRAYLIPVAEISRFNYLSRFVPACSGPAKQTHTHTHTHTHNLTRLRSPASHSELLSNPSNLLPGISSI